MKQWKQLLAAALTMCMLFTLLPTGVRAEPLSEPLSQEIPSEALPEGEPPALPAASPAEEGAQLQAAVRSDPGSPSGLPADVPAEQRIVHLDCGQQYFDPDWIIALIYEMAADGYTHLELGFGDQCLRFLLDDMTITAAGRTFLSDDVSIALADANANIHTYTPGELTEAEMDMILSAAEQAGVEIIPYISAPGNMYALLETMQRLLFPEPDTGNVFLDVDQYSSSLNLDCPEAVEFTRQLFSRYIAYFSGKGLTYFHIGGGDYGDDCWEEGAYFPDGSYEKYAAFLNDIAGLVVQAGMTPRVWNDDIARKDQTASFSPELEIVYRTADGTNPRLPSDWQQTADPGICPAGELEQMGYTVLNSRDDFWYIVGKDDSAETDNRFHSSYVAASKFRNNEPGGGSVLLSPIGSMFCIMVDGGSVTNETQQMVAADVRLPMRAMGIAMQNLPFTSLDTVTEVPAGFRADGTFNPDEFPVPSPPAGAVTLEHNGISVTAAGLSKLRVRPISVETPPGVAHMLAWRVEPATKNGILTGEAELRIPLPSVWNTADMAAFIQREDGTTGVLPGHIERNDYVVSCTFEGRACTVGIADAERPPEEQTLRDETSGVMLSAYGLTSLEVHAPSEALPQVPGAREVLAWDVTPQTAGGPYAGSAEISIPVPAGWDPRYMGAFVVEPDGSVTKLTGSYKNGAYRYVCPHFSVTGIYAAGNQEINIFIGEEAIVDLTNLEQPLSLTDVRIEPPSAQAEVLLSDPIAHTETAGGSFVLDPQLTAQTVPAGRYVIAADNSSYLTADSGNLSTGTGLPAPGQEAPANGQWVLEKTGSTYRVSQELSGEKYVLTTEQSEERNSWILGITYAYKPVLTPQSGDGGADWELRQLADGTYAFVQHLQYRKGGIIGIDQSADFFLKPAWKMDQTSAGLSLFPVREREITGGTYYDQMVTVRNLPEGTHRIHIGSASWPVTVSYRQESFALELGGQLTKTQQHPITCEPVYSAPGIVQAKVSGSSVVFTALQAGDVEVTVGDTRYYIQIREEDLSAVQRLEIEYWITNTRLSPQSVQIGANQIHVNTEEGALVTDLVAPTASREGHPVEFGNAKLMDIAKGEQQTTGNRDDKTTYGKAFTRVRYWQKVWQVYTEDGQWVTVRPSEGKYQLVAYYAEFLDISEELRINATDWGFKGDNVEQGSCGFAVQMVYEDGSKNPGMETAEDLRGSSIVYSHWNENGNGRGIGTIIFTGAGSNRIYKITATSGTMSVSRNAINSYQWTEDDRVVWEGEPQSSVMLQNSSIAPKADGIYNSLRWPRANSAILFRVYVKIPPKEQNLTVHYADEATGYDFYHYNIAVEPGTAFDPNFSLEGHNTLSHNTVTNIYGVSQTVSADLNTMPEIDGVYRFSDFTCKRVELINGGKAVVLYYEFKPIHKLVMDFGLPLVITQKDLNENLNEDLKIPGTAKPELTGGKFGKAAVTGGTTSRNLQITYTPNQILTEPEVLLLTVDAAAQNAGKARITHEIVIYPATTVYYEEDFMDSSGFTPSGAASSKPSQETQFLPPFIHVPENLKHIFGFDDSYFNETGMSGDRETTSSAAGSTASFLFRGTGFELFANCSPDTGKATVFVRNMDPSAGVSRMVLVDTAMKNSAYVQNQEVTAYGLPIVSMLDLPYGLYQVTVLHGNRGPGQLGGSLHLDGLRVFNTMSNLGKDIYPEEEANPQYLKVRDALLDGYASNAAVSADEEAARILAQIDQSSGKLPGAVLVSNTETMQTNEEVADMIKNTPKNEAFVYPGQAITLRTSKEVQLGLKAVNGSVDYQINGEPNTITTSTDMFYHRGLSGDVVITNPSVSSGILSVTLIKTVGAAAPEPAPVTEASLQPASAAETPPISLMRMPLALMSLPEPEEDTTLREEVFLPVSEELLKKALESIGVGTPEEEPAPDPVVPAPAPAEPESDDADSPRRPAPEIPEAALPFLDVAETYWARDAIACCLENKWMNGTSADTFDPEGLLTRGQFMAILWRYAGMPAAGASAPFADLSHDYYREAVAWGYENGVIQGLSDSEFAPEQPLTRQSMAAILYRFTTQLSGGETSYGEADLTGYADSESIGAYALPAMGWACESGLLRGTNEHRLEPGGISTRAQAATVIMRFSQYLA